MLVVVGADANVLLVPTATRVNMEIAVNIIKTAEAVFAVTLAQMETEDVQANKGIMEYQLSRSRCRIGMGY